MRGSRKKFGGGEGSEGESFFFYIRNREWGIFHVSHRKPGRGSLPLDVSKTGELTEFVILIRLVFIQPSSAFPVILWTILDTAVPLNFVKTTRYSLKIFSV